MLGAGGDDAVDHLASVRTERDSAYPSILGVFMPFDEGLRHEPVHDAGHGGEADPHGPGQVLTTR